MHCSMAQTLHKFLLNTGDPGKNWEVKYCKELQNAHLLKTNQTFCAYKLCTAVVDILLYHVKLVNI